MSPGGRHPSRKRPVAQDTSAPDGQLLDERWPLRKSVRETGLWPPHAAAHTLGLEPFEFIRMENKIVFSAAFSPLQ